MEHIDVHIVSPYAIDKTQFKYIWNEYESNDNRFYWEMSFFFYVFNVSIFYCGFDLLLHWEYTISTTLRQA